MTETSSYTEVLTVPEVMVRLRAGRSTVYDLIRSRQLASYKEGRSRRVPVQSVAEYIARKLEESR